MLRIKTFPTNKDYIMCGKIYNHKVSFLKPSIERPYVIQLGNSQLNLFILQDAMKHSLINRFKEFRRAKKPPAEKKGYVQDLRHSVLVFFYV